jgi:putative intracellular protease/amidase
MKIAILIYDGFTALDAVGPYEVLSCLPGAKVHFVSTEVGPKRANTNFLSVIADYTLNDIPDPEIIVVPGGQRERWPRQKISAYSPGFEKLTKLQSGLLLFARDH